MQYCNSCSASACLQSIIGRNCSNAAAVSPWVFDSGFVLLHKICSTFCTTESYLRVWYTCDAWLLYRLNRSTFFPKTQIQVSSERLCMPTLRQIHDEFPNHFGAAVTRNCWPRTHLTRCLEGPPPTRSETRMHAQSYLFETDELLWVLTEVFSCQY